MRGKLFGVGFGRTGTKSLQKALEILGYKTWHCLKYNDILNEFIPDECIFWGENVKRQVKEFDAISNGTGLPYAHLDSLYPGSKFILTTRDLDTWLRSQGKYRRLAAGHSSGSDNKSEVTRVFINENIYGSKSFCESLWKDAYIRHVESVLKFFENRPGDLLVLNIPAGEGWEKLCAFLDVDQPDKDFPSVNTGKDVERQSRRDDGQP